MLTACTAVMRTFRDPKNSSLVSIAEGARDRRPQGRDALYLRSTSAARSRSDESPARAMRGRRPDHPRFSKPLPLSFAPYFFLRSY